jgi:hypothetical protein
VDRDEAKTALAGTLVSSLHRLKDTDNNDGGFFVFGDLSVKIEGFFKIQFTLYEVRGKEVEYITAITSEPFQVHPAKNWPGMAESTFLTRSFSDQGVRLRLRKEPRFRLGPRGPASDDYQPRHYNTSRRRQSQMSSALSSATTQESPQLAITPQSQENIAGASRPAQIEPAGADLGSISSQTGGMYSMDTRKRGYSQSSHAGLYGGPSDEVTSKRSRQEIDEANQLPYTGQAQYPAAQGMSYGTKQFADPFQVQQPLQMYPQHPQQPQQSFDSFSPTYMVSPQTRTNRDQQGYFSPRRGEPFQPPSPYQSPPSRLPPTTQFQRSPAHAFQFNQPMQQASIQTSYGMQPQQQYAPQLLMQNMPPNRSPSNLGMYQQPDSDIDPMLAPKSSNILAGQGDMQPPMFYGRPSSAMQQMGTGQQIENAGNLYMGQRLDNMSGGDMTGYRSFDPLAGGSDIGGRADEEIIPRPR